MTLTCPFEADLVVAVGAGLIVVCGKGARVVCFGIGAFDGVAGRCQGRVVRG